MEEVMRDRPCAGSLAVWGQTTGCNHAYTSAIAWSGRDKPWKAGLGAMFKYY